MSDRLKELQRQRALAQEQAAWFEREIARESGVAPSDLPPVPTPAADAPAEPEKEMSAVDKEAEKILARFRHVEHPVRDEVKRGCLIYFFLAFGLLALALVGFYFLKKSGIPLTLPGSR